MSHQVVDAERQSQFLRGSLDMCLLALLARQPSHTYELTSRLEQCGLPGIGYGTLYPLVTRLRRLELIEEALEPSPAGPVRKVYSPTTLGRDALSSWSEQWLASTAVVRTLLIDAGALPTP
jgi:PadR family transcriptional regulator PadR